MAFRTCATCGAGDNPLSSLRFKKSRVDGKVYCERHLPDLNVGGVEEEPSAPSFAPSVRPSAGYVVIDCPDCAGGVHRPHQKPCVTCSGYGAVRIEAAMLNVYRPRAASQPSAPEILVEDSPPRL